MSRVCFVFSRFSWIHQHHCVWLVFPGALSSRRQRANEGRWMFELEEIRAELNWARLSGKVVYSIYCIRFQMENEYSDTPLFLM